VPGGLVSARISFQGYGLGSYSFFNQGVPIENAMAFQAPDTPGVGFHDLLTVFLSGSGGIESVINGTGAAVNSSFGGPSDVVSYPSPSCNGARVTWSMFGAVLDRSASPMSLPE
jgi:hypothetical protein